MPSKYERFKSTFQEAIDASGDPTREDLMELFAELKGGNGVVPQRPELWPVHTFIRSVIANPQVRDEWIHRAIGQVERTREQVAQVDQSDDAGETSEFADIDQAYQTLKENENIGYDFGIREFEVFNSDDICKAALRKAWTRLKKLPQIIATENIEYFSITYLVEERLKYDSVVEFEGVSEEVQREVIYTKYDKNNSVNVVFGANVQVKGYIHKIVVFLTAKEIMDVVSED